jgi:class 3 adenylate cyclase
VNLAARATKVARAGAVFVPETLTRDLAGKSAFSFRRVGPHRLKGFAEPVTFYSLERAAGGIGAA